MSYANPPHPKTRSALEQAFELAMYLVVTEDQREIQSEICRAVSAGELADALDALNRARKFMTPTWRRWHSEFVQAVDLQILRKPEQVDRREVA
jgi:hypothetical protein